MPLPSLYLAIVTCYYAEHDDEKIDYLPLSSGGENMPYVKQVFTVRYIGQARMLWDLLSVVELKSDRNLLMLPTREF